MAAYSAFDHWFTCCGEQVDVLRKLTRATIALDRLPQNKVRVQLAANAACATWTLLDNCEPEAAYTILLAYGLIANLAVLTESRNARANG